MDRNYLFAALLQALGAGRSLRGNVDRNMENNISERIKKGRSLRGNVDRNTDDVCAPLVLWVVPYVGTWIEMTATCLVSAGLIRRSLRGNVDRNVCGIISLRFGDSRSLRGNVDRNLIYAGADGLDVGRSLRGNVDRNHTSVHQSWDRLQSFPTWERG